MRRATLIPELMQVACGVGAGDGSQEEEEEEEEEEEKEEERDQKLSGAQMYFSEGQVSNGGSRQSISLTCRQI